VFSVYLIIGIFAGLMSGLFGIGGGIIVIPALSAIFLYHGLVPHESIMHMAVGTSLAVLVITSLSAMYAHHKHQAVRWDVVINMLPGLCIGATLGAVVAHLLPSNGLREIFSVFLIIMGMRLIMQAKQIESSGSLPSKRSMTIVSVLMGILASILGVGGGIIMVPYFLHCGLRMLEATGTSIACGLSIGLVASLSFMVIGLLAKTHIPWSTGYIYWPAFFGVAAASVFLAPLGALLAHKLPVRLLRRLFGVFLLVIAIDMMAV